MALPLPGYRNTLYPTLNTSPNRFAMALSMGRLPFSISDRWRVGMLGKASPQGIDSASTALSGGHGQVHTQAVEEGLEAAQGF